MALEAHLLVAWYPGARLYIGKFGILINKTQKSRRFSLYTSPQKQHVVPWRAQEDTRGHRSWAPIFRSRCAHALLHEIPTRSLCRESISYPTPLDTRPLRLLGPRIINHYCWSDYVVFWSIELSLGIELQLNTKTKMESKWPPIPIHVWMYKIWNLIFLLSLDNINVCISLKNCLCIFEYLYINFHT
jgi:hypothetical protein